MTQVQIDSLYNDLKKIDDRKNRGHHRPDRQWTTRGTVNAYLTDDTTREIFQNGGTTEWFLEEYLQSNPRKTLLLRIVILKKHQI